MNRPRVLIIQDVLYSYRVPILERVATEVELEVACVSTDKELETSFPVKFLKTRAVGNALWMPGLKAFCDRFDVVILQPHLSRPSVCLLPFRRNRSFIPVSWDIGVRVSYRRHYSLERPMNWDDRLYGRIMRRCAANIFYMTEPVDLWVRRGIPREKLFVAHNTVAIDQTPYSPEGRRDFLFIGKLYPEKRVDLLLDAYRDAYVDAGRPESFPLLHIVGGGSEESALMEKVRRDDMDRQVIFHHPIYDESRLAPLFQRSILCISPHQAGLSVLKSFAYGTAFVTRRDAITGGEIFNIRDGENGVLYDDDIALKSILSDAVAHPDKYMDMGRAAHCFYASEASPEAMAGGVLAAVRYAIDHPV